MPITFACISVFDVSGAVLIRRLGLPCSSGTSTDSFFRKWLPSTLIEEFAPPHCSSRVGATLARAITRVKYCIFATLFSGG